MNQIVISENLDHYYRVEDEPLQKWREEGGGKKHGSKVPENKSPKEDV